MTTGQRIAAKRKERELSQESLGGGAGGIPADRL